MAKAKKIPESEQIQTQPVPEFTRLRDYLAWEKDHRGELSPEDHQAILERLAGKEKASK